MTEVKKEFKLPSEISKVDNAQTRDLVIISIPKVGKSALLGSLTEAKNALIFDLEKHGYDFIPARKISIYDSNETTLWQAFQNYIKYRDLLLENKGKYDFLAIDGLSDLDVLSEIGGTLLYMNTVQGKSFNIENGKKLEYGDPKFKLVTSLPDGAGFQHTRNWFLQQIEYFRQISPYRVYAAHVTDKLIRENQKEEVAGSEIALTGKLKTIFAAKVTALAKLTAEDNKRYLSFDVANNGIIAGSRNPKLSGKILISEKQKDGSIKTFWENIYN